MCNVQEAELELTDRELPSTEDDSVYWVCGGTTEDRHCKIVCRNCGFMRDCSDP